jgi:transposase
MGRPPTGDGLRFGNDLLATSTRLAEGRSMGEAPRRPPGQAQRRRPPGLEPNGDRLVLRSTCRERGATGPNPTDRRRSGSKHHLVVEGQGNPLHAILTAANRHDVTQLLPLIDGIKPVRGRVGHPRRRPDRVFADRTYDSEPHRQALRDRGIRPYLAKRRTKHGSGLGKHRWVVERTFAWLHQFRRLRERYERRADIHEAFLKIGCALITWRFANSLC